MSLKWKVAGSSFSGAFCGQAGSCNNQASATKQQKRRRNMEVKAEVRRPFYNWYWMGNHTSNSAVTCLCAGSLVPDRASSPARHLQYVNLAGRPTPIDN